MLENIKSNYLIQYIFSLLNQKRKFKLVINNKNLQKNLDINLIDYKNLSRKYIVYEKDGIRKEYNLNDKLVFEGEYLDKERNGKGKEYYENDDLRFEGEYLNGKRNGIGKEYDSNGILVFKGEYLNGKRWNGNGYDSNNNIIYIL